MQNHDATEQFLAQWAHAQEQSTPLRILGGGSKAFLTPKSHATVLSTTAHQGVIAYEPSELCITIRSGTRLSDLEAMLAEHAQRLPFEPPHFGPATIGGAIACNHAGPARAFYGAARDYVLGVRMINGKGHVLRFGGQVMKNVAGYDLSRLQCGARGTLGLLLDVSVKVLPMFQREATVRVACDAASAITRMNRLAGGPLPISATFYDGRYLWLRLSGHAQAVTKALSDLAEMAVIDDPDFWTDVREQSGAPFKFRDTLWRISIPPSAPPSPEPALLEWNGALRWVKDPQDVSALTQWVHAQQGFMFCFKSVTDDPQPTLDLSPELLQLSQNLKLAFDPKHVWNPGHLDDAL